MQSSSRRMGVVLGFALMFVLLIANGLVTRRQVGMQVATQIWVMHSQQVLLELSQTESLIKDAETGQRGFLYTEDPKYLKDYQNAVSQVESHVSRLELLTADNPGQRARTAQLRSLSQAKLSELAHTISLYDSGRPQDAKALVKSDDGLILMNGIRTLIGQMREEEAALDASRSAAYKKSVRITIACIYLTSVVAGLGLILLAYSVIRQIEQRERHARQLADREEWFRVTLTSLGDAVMATDEKGLVTFLNPVAEKLIGLTLASAKGKPIGDIFPIFNESTLQPVENPIKRVLQVGRVMGLANHTVLQKTDGTMVPIEDSAAPIRDGRDKIVGVVLVFRDATSERRSQELLRKSEKLAAAARLASTVAHEINNPLEAIGNLIYIIAKTAGLPASAYDQLALVEHELERVSHITRQTLGFYRESKKPERFQVSSLVDSVLIIFTNKFQAKNITIERDFRECPPISGLSGELKQVVANLLSNAADAVPAGGTIRVELSCPEHLGDMVQISIVDNGPGIPPAVRDRIFEPFFTTKADVGTGLGLWVTKEIVARHGGSIEVLHRNDLGSSGTIFNVCLPRGEPQVHSQ
jgi:PAS domain S-box-containing protein